MNKLLGTWKTDPADIHSLDKYGEVTMEFLKDGHLRYVIHTKGEKEIALLTYSIEDNVLVTDQPSHPKTERTKFTVTDDGRLILDYIDRKSYYIKVA